jgi:hypothetical protein
MNAKQVKQLISKEMTNSKKRISVRLGECDANYERIEINYPQTIDYVSLNSIIDILKKHNFYIAQILNFFYPVKTTILLIREPAKR